MAAPDVEAVDFEPEEDDLMEDDAGAAEADGSPRAAHPRIRSAITGAGSSSAGGRRTKGRGFERDAETERHSRLNGRDYETLDSDGGLGPAQSIEGWIVLVTGVHEEAQDDDIHNAFGEFGPLKSVHLNLDRRTGFVKGYALIEYKQFEEAQDAITLMNGTTMLEQTINVDWAFCNGPCRRRGNARRSRSPARRRY